MCCDIPKEKFHPIFIHEFGTHEEPTISELRNTAEFVAQLHMPLFHGSIVTYLSVSVYDSPDIRLPALGR